MNLTSMYRIVVDSNRGNKQNATSNSTGAALQEVPLPPDTFIAERILDTIPRKDGVQGQEYLVKWKDSDEKTWEPSENIVSPALLHNYYTSPEFQNKISSNNNGAKTQASGSLL